MDKFDVNHAKTLQQTCEYEKLYEYCSLFPEDKISLVYLAICYFNGYGVQKSYEKSFLCDKKAAELKSADGLARLGLDYLYGYGTSKDEYKGFSLIKTAIDNGSVKALRFLGYCYEDGVVVEKDEAKAVEWYKKAVDAGDIKAMRLLGECYEQAKGIEKDETMAIKLYEEYITYVNEMSELADIYLKLGDLYADMAIDDDVKEIYDSSDSMIKKRHNKAKSDNYYAKSFRSYSDLLEQGEDSVEYRIGMMYLKGKGVEQNFQKAFDIFERLHISQENGVASFYLAICYLSGKGTPVNPKKGVEVLEIAANRGHILAKVYMIYFYLTGIGIEKNYSKANELISDFENKDEYKDLQKFLNLYKGISYYHGLGNKKNISKAKEYFENSRGIGSVLYAPLCDGDYRKADFLGSVIYHNNNFAVEFFVYADKKISVELLVEAYNNDCLSRRGHHILSELSNKYAKSLKAKSNAFNRIKKEITEVDDNTELLYELGKCYLFGYGTQINYPEAISCLIKSRTKGNKNAAAYLAYCYYKGLGVEKNDGKVVEILNDSAENGGETSIFLGLITYSGMCGIEQNKKRGIELIEAGKNVNRAKYECYIQFLSSPRGDSYVSFLFKDYLNSLHYSFDPSVKTKIIVPFVIQLIYLMIFKNPQSTNFSKKELYKMLLEYKSDFNDKFDMLVQNQEPIIDEIERISSYTERLPEMSRKLTKIDEKLDVVLNNIEKNIQELKSELPQLTKTIVDDEKRWLKFSQEAMGIIISTLKGNVTSLSVETAHLHDVFGDYWNHLDTYTQNSLVSARILFSNSNRPEYFGMDYSGVVIAVTSALENELKIRFFDGYKAWIKKQYGMPGEIKWPRCLLKYNTREIATDFTIGTMPYIFGVSKELNSNEKRLLNEYIKTILSTEFASKGIEIITEARTGKSSLIDRCESVRLSYRNKAAHVGPVDKDLAKECCTVICDAVIAENMIDSIQGLLLDFVIITSNFGNTF